jgi:hypothetical protein
LAIPLVMSDMSTTAASNFPAGTEAPSNADDFFRAIQAILRTTNAKGSDIASAATTDIGAATGEFVDVTGTTTITALGTIAAGIVRTVRFTGALTLTHNATSLILPGSANITTANGDCAMFRSLGSGNWKCVSYIRQDGKAVIATPISDDSITAALLADSAIGFTMINGTLTASVSANALTVAIKTKAGTDPSATDPVLVVFRNATITDGTYSVISVIAATSLTVSSGSTLGTVSAQAARLAIVLLNNAGTGELAINNLSGGVSLDETGVISTTAEGGAGAADSSTVIYSTTARSNVAYRVVGIIDITEATAGTWASAPTKVSLVDGQALAMSSIGFGQTWQNVTGSRAVNTTYYNTTGRPIMAIITAEVGSSINIVVGGVTVLNTNGGSIRMSYTFIVPSGATYIWNSASGTLIYWAELR